MRTSQSTVVGGTKSVNSTLYASTLLQHTRAHATLSGPVAHSHCTHHGPAVANGSNESPGWDCGASSATGGSGVGLASDAASSAVPTCTWEASTSPSSPSYDAWSPSSLSAPIANAPSPWVGPDPSNTPPPPAPAPSSLSSSSHWWDRKVPALAAETSSMWPRPSWRNAPGRGDWRGLKRPAMQAATTTATSSRTPTAAPVSPSSFHPPLVGWGVGGMTWVFRSNSRRTR